MNNKNNFSILHSEIKNDERICPSLKIFFSDLIGFTLKSGFCFATNKFFAEKYKKSTKTISTWISKLKETGYIRVEMIYGKGSKEIIQRRLYIIKNKTAMGVEVEVKDNNIKNNNKYIDILNFWNSKKLLFEKELNIDIEKAINKILENYSLDDIKKTVENYNLILNDDKYFYTYKYRIYNFLNKNFNNFIDIEKAKERYLKDEFKEKKKDQKRDFFCYEHKKINNSNFKNNNYYNKSTNFGKTKFHNFENKSLNYTADEINSIIKKIKEKDKEELQNTVIDEEKTEESLSLEVENNDFEIKKNNQENKEDIEIKKLEVDTSVVFKDTKDSLAIETTERLKSNKDRYLKFEKGKIFMLEALKRIKLLKTNSNYNILKNKFNVNYIKKVDIDFLKENIVLNKNLFLSKKYFKFLGLKRKKFKFEGELLW